jgi:hypothetical protein
MSVAALARAQARGSAELYKTLSRMGRATSQGEIGVLLDGRYYGITTYAEE